MPASSDGTRNCLPDIPEAENDRLEALLYPTIEVERAIQDLPMPGMIALGLGPRSDAGLPRARIILEHAASTVQAARYHLYMAHYEQLRLGTYSDPPNPGGGDVAAYFNFTSFALHAIATESHLVLALATQYRMRKEIETTAGIKPGEAYKYLASRGLPHAAVLRPFEKDKHWKWLRLYRHRYSHQDPMLVEEMGLQYSLRGKYWQTEVDQEAGVVTNSIAIRGSDPPDTNIAEMLSNGTRAFNLLGKQLGEYTAMLRDEIKQKWTNPHIRWVGDEEEGDGD